jgi:hypothetical protein
MDDQDFTEGVIALMGCPVAGGFYRRPLSDPTRVTLDADVCESEAR